MNFLKNIFARIWAVWGLISFTITFFIFFLPAMISWLIPGKPGQQWFCSVSKVWMTIWLNMVGCPIRVKGKEHFKKGTTYIVTCNHNSLMDIPLSTPFVPGANKTIAKSSFTKVPLFGFYYAKGAVLVDRKSEKSRKESFEKMKNVLNQHIHMGIYPEGTRNRTDEPLKKFHDGAFRLAISTNTPIIPAIIFNTKKALPLTKSFYFLPTRLKMHFLEAIPVEGKTMEQLKEEVFGVMRDYYVENR